MVPIAALKNADSLPAGAKPYVSALGNAEQAVFTIGPEGDHLQLAAERHLPRRAAASALLVNLENTTATLRKLIAREHQQPNPADLSGCFGGRKLSPRRPAGVWPMADRARLRGCGSRRSILRTLWKNALSEKPAWTLPSWASEAQRSAFAASPPETVDRLINGALDAGLNVIDTAECYPGGEEKVGQAVSSRRNEYFLFTKCGHDGVSMAKGDHWNPNMMAATIDRSLKRLQTDYVDLLQLHSCTEAQLRQGDVIDVVRRARDSGKTRFIGYSGDGRAALRAVESGVFDTLQISVSIADQEGIDLVLPSAKARGMGVIAKRPIANAIWKEPSKPDPYYQAYWERFQKLDYDFLKTDLPQAVSKALRFTLSIDGVHTAIVGTTQPDRWQPERGTLESRPARCARVPSHPIPLESDRPAGMGRPDVMASHTLRRPVAGYFEFPLA